MITVETNRLGISYIVIEMQINRSAIIYHIRVLLEKCFFITFAHFLPRYQIRNTRYLQKLDELGMKNMFFKPKLCNPVLFVAQKNVLLTKNHVF